MTEKKGIVLFLVTVLLFAILFILIYQPAGYMRDTQTMIRWHLLPWNKHI